MVTRANETAPIRGVAGWVAVALSTALASMWAFWGSIENFHEGWYYRDLWHNVVLMAVQYLPWMFVPMLAGLVGLWRPLAGVIVHVALAAGAFRLFGFHGAGAFLLAFPTLMLGALYGYGRARPLHVARRILIAVPLLTAVVSGAYPGWRALTRPSSMDLSMRRIEGNGVALTWAPSGPGWDSVGFSWYEARRRCEYLVADGSVLAAAPQNAWRVPTVDEVVRTMRWRGRNAVGRWDPATQSATYQSMPDKEAPLWNPYSQVIYWWTADERDAERAFRITYNGQVYAIPKKLGPAYSATRCVKVGAQS